METSEEVISDVSSTSDTSKCNVCGIYLRRVDLQAHLQGKKHLKKAQFLNHCQRKIIISPTETGNVIGMRTKKRILSEFAKYGDVIINESNARYMVVEFPNRTSAEAVLSECPVLNAFKLQAKSYIPAQRDMIIEKAQKDTSRVAYDNIKHIFSKENTFNNQLQMFLFAVQPNSTEVQLRYDTVGQELCALLQSTIFPNCRLYKFGSLYTGLGLADCDLDIYVDIGEPIYDEKDTNMPKTGLSIQTVFKKVKKVLFTRSHIFRYIRPVPKAKVPIIKFVHAQNSVSCDLSFTSVLGLYKGELTRFYVSLDSRAKVLTVLLKYWARHFKLFGQISTYGLCQLVFFYLQQVSILPPLIALLDPSLKKTINGWPANFNPNIKVPLTTNTSTIPELLSGFFNFYAKLPFKSIVICPLDGKIYQRSEFQRLSTLPDYMAAYKDSPGSEAADRFNLTRSICVQDPVELNYNVTACYSQSLCQKFIDYCALGAFACEASKKNKYKDVLHNLFDTVAEKDSLHREINMFISTSEIQSILSMNTIANIEHENILNQCYIFFVNSIRSILEKIFKLHVEVKSTLPTKHMKKIEQQLIPLDKNFNNMKFYCVGKHYASWNSADFLNPKLNLDENPLGNMAQLVDEMRQKSSTQNIVEDTPLEFSYNLHQYPRDDKTCKLYLIMRSEGQSCCAFKQFAEMFKKIFPSLIRSMIVYKKKHNNDSQIIGTK